jgi:hypothetical protein
MLKKLMMTTVGATLLASGALAASDPPSMRDAAKADPRNPRFHEETFATGSAMNKHVVDRDGDSLGTIRDFYVGSDEYVYAIVEVERPLASDTFVAVPYWHLKMNRDTSGKMSEDVTVMIDDKEFVDSYFNMKYGEMKTPTMK